MCRSHALPVHREGRQRVDIIPCGNLSFLAALEKAVYGEECQDPRASGFISKLRSMYISRMYGHYFDDLVYGQERDFFEKSTGMYATCIAPDWIRSDDWLGVLINRLATGPLDGLFDLIMLGHISVESSQAKKLDFLKVLKQDDVLAMDVGLRLWLERDRKLEVIEVGQDRKRKKVVGVDIAILECNTDGPRIEYGLVRSQ